VGLLAAPRAQAQVGMLIAVVKYVPNRALDALDLLRLRLRVGPGNAFAARAGEPFEYFRGRYRSVFAGLPGPRRGPLPRLPVGIEARDRRDSEGEGARLAWGDPGYALRECALGFQAGVFGLDLGTDPTQWLDFAFGLIGLDPADDDW
jgi:hypothetical protein